MNDIEKYNATLSREETTICTVLMKEIDAGLKGAEGKVWHGHPVWFIDGNPVVGYSKEKSGIRLMFWSGKSFDEDALSVKGVKFKDASIFYNTLQDINTVQLKRWLKKAQKIQWDYKNIVKRRGKLVRLSVRRAHS